MAKENTLVELARSADLSILVMIEREMAATGGNVSEVARRFDVSREAIYRHIRNAKRPVKLSRTHTLGVPFGRR